MKQKFILSALFLTLSFAAFSQKNPTGRTAEKGLIKITVLYPYAEGKTFNINYYQSKHMPMVAGYLGNNLVRYTIEKGIASGIPNQPLPFTAIGTFYVKNLGDYQAAIAPHRDAIRADFANYTNIAPVILVSEVIK
ncbi:EthD family reductase [Pedobacter sp. SYP-B3415]|uniref:EthD family reductase n=1 Tax=Pedobacter sp. SYP-B3415 TaxID=2496641 RepID=UPI00101DC363|nr:EthD family reductase [Pedobacter sp. SYP-B3415]